MSNTNKITKLGIVVVYLVSEDDEGLLDLHLSMIERYTSVPYTIYGSANRLIPKFLRKLELHPHIELCQIPATDLRGYQEHAYYLDRLIDTAVSDGVSHVVMLNVDSFPVREFWAQALAGRLSDSCVLAAVKRIENLDNKPHPSCILFHRDFYLKYKPTLTLSDEVLNSPEGRQYVTESGSIYDTGIGYGFTLAVEDLKWYPIVRTNGVSDHYIIGSIYGDLIFHLGGATRQKKIHLPERQLIDKKLTNTFVRLVYKLMRSIEKISPQSVRYNLERFRFSLLFPAAQKALDSSERAYEQIRQQLLDDPEGYLTYLRTGVRR